MGERCRGCFHDVFLFMGLPLVGAFACWASGVFLCILRLDTSGFQVIYLVCLVYFSLANACLLPLLCCGEYG